MAKLFKTSQLSAYRDRRFRGSQEEFEHALRTSTTVYVGNLSFYTTEEQIHELFSKCGEIKRIVMGLDKNTMTPCGFCFVVYYTREDAEDSVKYVSGTMLDERPIRVDFDWGFEDGRQWGRGRSGGQVRDEYRTDYDPGRGGYGKLVQRELSEMQRLGAMALLGGLPPPGGPPFPRQGMHHHMSHQGGGGGGGYGQHGRRPRRIERRPQHHHRPSGEGGGGGGGAPGGGRKRGRDDDDDVQMEDRKENERSGLQRHEQKQQQQQQPTEGNVSASAEKQKNPRFRERGDDSDEEGDKA